MKYIISGMLCILCGCCFAQEPVEIPAETPSEKDFDGQVSLLKQEIAKYTSLVKQFDRKASSLQGRDYSGSRNAALMRDHCQGIVTDLQKHLDDMVKKHDEQKNTVEASK